MLQTASIAKIAKIVEQIVASGGDAAAMVKLLFKQATEAGKFKASPISCNLLSPQWASYSALCSDCFNVERLEWWGRFARVCVCACVRAYDLRHGRVQQHMVKC